jgi:phage FluMu protein Com
MANKKPSTKETPKPNKPGKTKPKGVNEGLKKGMDKKEFQDRVLCKTCGKDIEFTKGMNLFLKCPRCKKPLERSLKQEVKQSNQIIYYDFIRKNRRYFVFVGIALALIAIAYNIVGYLCCLFDNDMWWLALMSLPLVAISCLLTFYTRFKNTTHKYAIMSWVLLGLNIGATVLIIVSAILNGPTFG